MKISDLTRSDNGKLAAVYTALAIMLALGVALVSCSDDVNAVGIGASRTVADAAGGSVEGIDVPKATKSLESAEDSATQESEAVEPANDETISQEGDGSVDTTAVTPRQPASGSSQSECLRPCPERAAEEVGRGHRAGLGRGQGRMDREHSSLLHRGGLDLQHLRTGSHGKHLRACEGSYESWRRFGAPQRGA